MQKLKTVLAGNIVSLEHAEQKMKEAKEMLDDASRNQRNIAKALQETSPLDENRLDELYPFVTENNRVMGLAYATYAYWCDAVNELRWRSTALSKEKGQV